MTLLRPPYVFARQQGATLLEQAEDGTAVVAVREPGKSAAITEMRRFLACPIELKFYPEDEYKQLLESLYQQGDASAVAADVGENLDLDKLVDELPQVEDLLESQDDAPIIRLINALLTQAVKEGASDIHIEPFENRLSIRLRVDGILNEVMNPPRKLAPLLVSRIKVMSRLDIAEKRLPQDGRISLKVAGRPVDIRVSTLPSGHGERVVLRLLDKQAGRLDLAQLGMRQPHMDAVDSMIHRAHGILLVTGPTGSGKTTTLYAALARLNDQSRNIMTVEDPIEYYIDGIGQTQVNSKVDMSFARGLRAILRQDPDVVMVGEIRDLETAKIAVQASLTGHLVLSTLHTNSAIGAMTRLHDMGIEPFLLSSSLLGVISQRLVRKLDPEFSLQRLATEADFNALNLDFKPDSMIWQPQQDLPRGQQAYRGRTGIYELVGVDDNLRELIHQQASEVVLLEHARKKWPSIVADGWAKVEAGLTSLDELVRVTRVS
ncbi:MAG: type II secretion system ATPase GspE [Xanthomonadales bacterium]|nr:type II secretion system ATPase GspE [Xanthomonadales bacterium]